jgi:hypothetical protein
MKKRRYFKLMHINMTRELKDYLDWQSNKINLSMSEIVRFLIREDLRKNKTQWLQDMNYEYDELPELHRFQ